MTGRRKKELGKAGREMTLSNAKRLPKLLNAMLCRLQNKKKKREQLARSIGVRFVQKSKRNKTKKKVDRLTKKHDQSKPRRALVGTKA